MCRSTGALQVLHLATCYSRRGYPGRPNTIQPREPLVNDRFWCSAGRQTSLAYVIGLGFAALSFCRRRSWHAKTAEGRPLIGVRQLPGFECGQNLVDGVRPANYSKVIRWYVSGAF
jgi:hypothetical protein